MNEKMVPSSDIRLTAYYEVLEQYQQTEVIADYLIGRAIKDSGISTMQVSHRIKSPDSYLEKLNRKPDRYPTPYDMTDMLGFRIICYFADQVDAFRGLIQDLFVVDVKNSVDKRKQIAVDSFGYLSLHFIVSLPPSEDYPEELTKCRFEIQIRTVLQHTWAEIEHDLGYKTDFGIPREARRGFSRIASLLEVADGYFVVIRDHLAKYDESVIEKLKSDDVSDMPLDLITLREFMKYSTYMQSFTRDIADISGAELVETNPEPYLAQLADLGITDLEGLLAAAEREHDHALLLARSVLEDSGIEELTSTVALYYLCRAVLVWGDYTKEQIEDYYAFMKDQKKIEHHTRRILSQREKYGSAG
ncbi:MAG: hypothetical protein IKP75_08925 [Oscillospiraceae bacterium]|nr:hypothetical protein [Oscillospiraceae bacterium]